MIIQNGNFPENKQDVTLQSDFGNVLVQITIFLLKFMFYDYKKQNL